MTGSSIPDPFPAPELRLLILDDVEWDAGLMRRELVGKGLACAVRVCNNEPEFRQALVEFDPHLILSDFRLPSFSGRAALLLAKQMKKDVPFILVSGAIGEENVAELLREGATDYVAKSNLSRLEPVVRRALRELQTRVENRRTIQALRETITVIEKTRRSFKSSALGQLRQRLERLVETTPWW